jgi:hypothetical protein
VTAEVEARADGLRERFLHDLASRLSIADDRERDTQEPRVVTSIDLAQRIDTQRLLRFQHHD